jgi:hypothetical protein
VRGLAPSYEGSIKMDVVMCDDADQKMIEEQFGADRHGLLVRDAEGKIIDKISGHMFGKDEIVAKLASLKD